MAETVTYDFEDRQVLLTELEHVGAEIGKQLVGPSSTFASHCLTCADVDLLHHAEQEALHVATQINLASDVGI